MGGLLRHGLCSGSLLAIRAAKVQPECAGKLDTVVFRYQLYGDATANPKVTSRTDPPNIMWIESQPEAALVSKAAKK